MILIPEKISGSNFKDYGDLISLKDSKDNFTINQGWTRRYNNLSNFFSLEKNNSTPSISIFKGYKRPSPLNINMLECHPLASQAFIPLNGSNWPIIVCTGNINNPNLKNLKCFIARKNQGINIYPGIWHHPLITLDQTQDFLIIDRNNKDDLDNENLVECEFNDILVSI